MRRCLGLRLGLHRGDIADRAPQHLAIRCCTAWGDGESPQQVDLIPQRGCFVLEAFSRALRLSTSSSSNCCGGQHLDVGSTGRF